MPTTATRILQANESWYFFTTNTNDATTTKFTRHTTKVITTLSDALTITDVTHARWRQSEEKLLAETYIQILEDPRLGIDQTSKSFWCKVTSEYNWHASYKRTKDMITRKSTALTRDCNKFVRILEEHARLSTWEVLKDYNKWRRIKVIVPRRRVRTTEDIVEPNELFRDETIPRTPARQGLPIVKNLTRPNRQDNL
ncbi:hypothetical protein Tco_0844483 [Tanacetum coccineum]